MDLLDPVVSSVPRPRQEGEAYDAESGQLVGDLPQAFAHVGLVNGAWRLDQVDRPR